MKSKSLLIFLFGFAKMLVGQDSLTVETVQDSAYVPPQYSSVYDDVFMNKKETKWLFKVNLLASDFRVINQAINFEHKLNKNLSFNYSLGMIANFQYYNVRDYERKMVIGVQPRWYFKNSNMVNNHNGNYVGLSAFYSFHERFELRNKNSTNWALAATYGIQRRVFNRWYIDWQLGVGMDRISFKNESEFQSNQIDYWLQNQFTLGLTFGGGKKSATNKCDLFSCFEEEKGLWKFDIRDIFKSYSAFNWSIALNPEYERKIGKSSFSINTGLGVGYANFFYDNFNSGNSFGVNATIEPRYYYNMKKRIATGKSANNLSGNYFSINFNSSYSKSFYTNSTIDSVVVTTQSELSGNLFVIEPRWGIQRRLFKNGFLDISLSPFYFRKSIITYNGDKVDGSIANRTPFEPLQEGFQFYKGKNSTIPFPKIYFKIGFAF